MPDPVEQLTAALTEAAGAPVDPRPARQTRATATTPRTSRCSSRARRAARRARSRRRSSRAAAAVDGVVAGHGRRAGLRQLRARRHVVRPGARERARGGRPSSAAAPPRRRERVQVEMVSANPTGPMTVAAARNGAYGDCVARLLAFAGNDGRARVLLQRRRRPDGPLPRVGRRGAARRGAARGRLPRRLHRRAREDRRRSRSADAGADRGGAGAVPDQLRHVRAPERRRGGDAGGDRAARHVRGGRRALGADVPPTATRRTASSSAPTGRRPTSRPTPPTCAASTRKGFDRLSTSSAPTTTATSAACRRWPRCSATRASRSRC